MRGAGMVRYLKLVEALLTTTSMRAGFRFKGELFGTQNVVNGQESSRLRSKSMRLERV